MCVCDELISNLLSLRTFRAYLEVAKNLPFGENCKCRTSAECASNDCVVCKVRNLGINVATLEFFSTPMGSDDRPYPSDDIVRCLLGFRPWTGNAVDAARILITARTAFANRPPRAGASGPMDSLITLAVSSPPVPSNDVTVGERISAIGSNGPTSDPPRRIIGDTGSGLPQRGRGVFASGSGNCSSSTGLLRRESVRALSSAMVSVNRWNCSRMWRETDHAHARGR